MTEILRRNGDNVALGKSQNQFAMQEGAKLEKNQQGVMPGCDEDSRFHLISFVSTKNHS